MLNFKLQIAVILISLLMMGYILYLIRQEIIELKYSSIWLVVGMLMIVVAVQPDLVSDVARLLGIGLPVNALFLFTLLFILMILMVVTIAISKVSLKHTRLAQEIALLRQALETRTGPAHPRRRAAKPRGGKYAAE
jgi:hypothetical protein